MNRSGCYGFEQFIRHLASEVDAVAFVQPRKRVYSHGSGDTPREDPLVQQVVGQLASTAFIATSTVQAVARGLGEVDRFRERGEAVPESLLFLCRLFSWLFWKAASSPRRHHRRRCQQLFLYASSYLLQYQLQRLPLRIL